MIFEALKPKVTQITQKQQLLEIKNYYKFANF